MRSIWEAKGIFFFSSLWVSDVLTTVLGTPSIYILIWCGVWRFVDVHSGANEMGGVSFRVALLNKENVYIPPLLLHFASADRIRNSYEYYSDMECGKYFKAKKLSDNAVLFATRAMGGDNRDPDLVKDRR